MSATYILVDRVPVKVDTRTWAEWFERNDRHVKDETVDGVRVSTVFLGIDYSIGEGTPLLFETMIFGGPFDQHMERCSTWAEAEKMHHRACVKAFGR